MKKLVALIPLLFMFGMLSAQDTAQQTEAATGLRADGKIYVVIAIVVTILLGLFIYVARLDRKISRMEKQQP